MKNLTDVTAKLEQLQQLKSIAIQDKGERCNLRFDNPNGAGVIELEFDYNLSEEELAVINFHLPVSLDKQAESLAILKGEPKSLATLKSSDVKGG